jgi:hypothetical protein
MREEELRTAAQPWQPMTVILAGRVPDVIQQGGGKLTCPGPDPGGPHHPKR